LAGESKRPPGIRCKKGGGRAGAFPRKGQKPSNQKKELHLKQKKREKGTRLFDLHLPKGKQGWGPPPRVLERGKYPRGEKTNRKS